MIQRSKKRYSNMLLNMRSITRQKRSYGHPLHPDLTPDVLTCVLSQGTVSSGRESEVESAHLFLTIIHFSSACHLTKIRRLSQSMYTCLLKICLIIGQLWYMFFILEKFIQFDCYKGHLNKALIDQKYVHVYVYSVFIWNWLDERI